MVDARSLRERLAAKAARRVTIPVAVEDPTSAHDALQRANLALAVHPDDGDADERVRLSRAREAAQAAYDGCFVDVEFEALPADIYEAILESHIDPDGDGDELVSDWDAVLPELLGASAVDESLRDVEWWREQLAQPTWSAGDKITLRLSVVRLNTDVAVRAPKG